MEMEINVKKALKVTTLLITSLLIANASASIVRQMELQGTITVGLPQLIWIEGEDVSATISGSLATISLTVENGTDMNFTSALYLKNNGTASYNYNITVSSGLSSSDFEIAMIHIYTNSSGPWAYVDSIDLTNSNDYYQGTLNGGDYLRFTIEVKAIKNNISRSFTVKVEYW